MAMTVYRSAGDELIIVPACLTPCMEAEQLFGVLWPEKSLLLDSDCSVPFRVRRAVHSHGFAAISEAELQLLSA